MEWNEEIIKKTTQFGVLGYPLSKCLNILDLDPSDAPSYSIGFQDKNDDIYKAYQKGKDLADFAFDSKLFEMGRAGDMKAMREFETRKKRNKLKI